MYKTTSVSPHYFGEDYSRTIPIHLFDILPEGKPEPVIPHVYEQETLDKVGNNLQLYLTGRVIIQ